MVQATAGSNCLLSEARKISQQFHLSPQDIDRITKRLCEKLDKGLLHDGSTQIPAFVSSLPDGTEKGTYLAVDLGGTNCRVCLIRLHGDTTYDMIEAKHTIPKSLMVNSSHEPLFDFIANATGHFLNDHAEDPEIRQTTQTNRLELGFTFSFTFINSSISSGTMLQWDKGWCIPEALGKDPGEMLQAAIDRARLPVHVAALTSDSVGTLMARSYTSKKQSPTLLGAIFGTGTNAAYVERREKIIKLHGHKSRERPGVIPPQDLMVMNTEWGGLCDEENEILVGGTPFDQLLDQASSNPLSQKLEKQISGLYLGEVVRLVIKQLLDQGLFDMRANDASSPLFIPYAIDTAFLSRLAEDDEKHLETSKRIISRYLGVSEVSTNDAQAMRLIAEAVVRRSGRLAGAAMAAIVLRSGRLSMPKTSPRVKNHRQIIVEDHITMGSETKTEGRYLNICTLVTGVFQWAIRSLQVLVKKPQPAAVEAKTLPSSLIYHNINYPEAVDIGVDGSLFEFYPSFEEYVRGALRDVPGIGTEREPFISIGLAKSGSSLGAALVAQSASSTKASSIW